MLGPNTVHARVRCSLVVQGKERAYANFITNDDIINSATKLQACPRLST